MALEFQNITVPLAVGVDSKSDDKLQTPDKLIVLENAVLNTKGKAELRPGYAERLRTQLSGASISAGDALDTFGNELLLFNGPAFYSWIDGVGTWKSKGFIPPVVATGDSIVRSVDRTRSVPDAATAGGQTVFAYEDSTGGVRITVRDDATGNILQSDTSINSSAVNPKVVAFETPVVVAIIYRVTTTLRCMFYTPATGSLSAEFTPSSDINSTCALDAIPYQSKCALAYRTTATAKVKVAVLLETGAFAASIYPSAITITADPASTIALVYQPSPQRLWIGWSNTTAGVRCAYRDGADFTNTMPAFTFAPSDVDTSTEKIAHTAHGLTTNTLVQFSTTGGLPSGLSAATNYYVIVSDADHFQVSASDGPGSAVNLTTQGTGVHTLQVYAATVDNTTTAMNNLTGAMVPGSTTQIRWFYEQSAASAYNTLTKQNTFTTALVAGTAATLKRSVGLASKAWVYNSVQYVAVAHDATLQATYFVLDSSGNVVAKMLPTVGGGLTAKTTSLPNVRADADGVTFRFPKLAKERLVSQNDDVFTLKGVWDSELRFTDPTLHLSAELGDNLHIIGGELWAYDGYQAVEHGFHLFPENGSLAQTTSGSLTLLATYQYRFTYEWVDAKGQLHRSAPSPVVSITLTGSNQTVTVTLPTYRITAKTGVSIAVYRSLANGSVFYRESSITSPKLSDTTADTVSFSSTTADTTLVSNEQLYTNGGAVDNDGPPPCVGIAQAKNRVWLIDSEHPNTPWFSKVRQEGLGIAFSQLFVLQVPPEGGDTVAIAGMDDKVLFFKESRIYYTAGDGPADDASGQFFPDPVLITTDVGCTNPNSIVLTPAGLMFQSAKGIYLMDRGLQSSYAGAPVEQFNDLTVKAATLLSDKNQVRFLTEEGTTLVYFYFFDQWGWFADQAGVDAVDWQGTYQYLRSDGRVRYETPGAYQDVSTGYGMRIRTAPFRFADLNGFQRVRRMEVLGDYVSHHRLTASFLYDFQGTASEELTADSADWTNPTDWGSGATYGSESPYGGDGDSVYQLRGRLPRQKCSSLQVELRSYPLGGPGQGLNLNALSFEVGMKRGLNKTRLSKTLT